MDHMKLSDELRQQLLESAAWGKAGIVLSEETVEETVEEAKKSKKTKKEEKEEGGDPKAFGGKKGDESQTHKGKDDEVCEEVAHVCPLCVSQLEEAIDEERILEHLNVVVGLVDRLSKLDENDEDVETIIDATIQELLFQDVDEEE